MKKILLLAAALLALGSCAEKPLVEEKVDSIKLSAEEAVFNTEAGKANVIVESSDAWTLSAEETYEWVTPSVNEGQDGDIVTFSVVENYEADRTAVFTFTCGEASAKYTVISHAGEVPAVKLLSEAEITLSYEKNEFTVKVSSPLEYRKLKFSLSEGAGAWLSRKATVQGDTENEAEFKFQATELTEMEGRSAVITISGEGLIPVEVKVNQLAKPVLSVAENYYKAELGGGELLVPVTANVEYDVNVPEEAKSWLTLKSTTAEGLLFDVQALQSGRRTAVVSLIEKKTATKAAPMEVKFTVTQVETIIKWAADLHENNRLFPKWVNANPGRKANPATVECLVNVTKFGKLISTLMGVEDNFLLRFGDSGKPDNVLQLATKSPGAGGGTNKEFMDFPFDTNRWYHIACTFTGNLATVYIDGVKAGELSTWLYGMPLGNTWSHEVDTERAWWYGYSYDENRGLDGYMTELRIWNVALTEEQINEPDHFYTVDPASPGLVCYWKFTEGEGETVANKATSKDAINESLYGELKVKKVTYKERAGDPGIKWVSVGLPDK